MPGQVAPVANEREGLLAFLTHQREAVKIAAFGLTDDQARATPTASGLSVGGLVKHLAFIEQSWNDTINQTPAPSDDGAYDDYGANFQLQQDEALAGACDRYDEVAATTEATIAAVDLDQAVPVPDASWFPDDVDAWSVRWVLLHLIEETARHAGHADIIREAVDGATAHSLMAAAEHWPALSWVQPWTPPAA